MAFARAKIKELEKGLYLIDDAGESTCYLVCGRERAALIDTANGREDLKAIVRSLTDLPLTVVNTHGHVDHVLGNVYFNGAYIHPEDMPLAEGVFARGRAEMEAHGLKPCLMHPLQIGETIDLGGETLEVVSLRGHTPGSIGLLDRRRRVIFSGDGLNPHLWMQLPHSLPIRELREMLLKLKRDFGGGFDRVLNGHADDYRSADVVDHLIRACDEMLAGQRQEDKPYICTWMPGDFLQHPVGDIPGECIVYTIDKL